MRINLDKVLSEANKRHTLRGKTIGEDIMLPEVAAALFQSLIDQQREQIEDSMTGSETKNFKELGKLALLNRLEETIHGDNE
jgi:hypothetical protein